MINCIEADIMTLLTLVMAVLYILVANIALYIKHQEISEMKKEFMFLNDRYFIQQAELTKYKLTNQRVRSDSM